MKILFFAAVLLVGLSGSASAELERVLINKMYPPVTPVTYRPKDIKPDTTVDSIQAKFANSTKTVKKTPDGGQIVTLSNYSEGNQDGKNSPSVSQLTNLTLVIGPDGKIKSYDMTQEVITSGWGDYTNRTTDFGNSCFSDCEPGHSAKDLVDASNNAGAHNTIPAGGTSKNSLISTTPNQQKTYASNSNP